MLAPRPSRLIARAAVIAAVSIGVAVGAASAAIADTAAPDDAVQTVPAGEEAPTHFEWD